jgi:hypothetical protein
MINKEDLVKLRKGEWEFLSSKMTLTKDGNNIGYSGAGIIRQIKQKCFKYIIFASDLTGTFEDEFRHYFDNKLRNGEMVPDSEKYTLTTIEGWASSNLYFININYQKNGSIITGYAHELVNVFDHTEELKELNNLNEINKKCTETHSPKLYNAIPRIKYIFFEKLNFPANLPVEKSSSIKGDEHYLELGMDALKFKTPKYQIELWRENKFTEYTIKSLVTKEKLDDFIEDSSIECLEFCLGRYVPWDIKIVYEGNIERTHIKQVNRKIKYKVAKPPLRYEHSECSPYFEELYKKFLKFILEDKINSTHSISKYLSEIYNSFNLGFNAQVLTLPVQIEGLLHNKDFDNTKKPDKDLIIGIEAIKTLVDRSKKDLGISKEVFDTFNQQMRYLLKPKNFSVPSILSLLRDKQVINERDKNAWREIRNRKAHGEQLELTQENINYLTQVTVLLYHLIFHLIDYKGWYTDYGELGYPIKTYPKDLQKSSLD